MAMPGIRVGGPEPSIALRDVPTATAVYFGVTGIVIIARLTCRCRPCRAAHVIRHLHNACTIPV